VVLPKYGVGTFTGTPVNNLAVDASRNVYRNSFIRHYSSAKVTTSTYTILPSDTLYDIFNGATAITVTLNTVAC
jgi:hypothetical protein